MIKRLVLSLILAISLCNISFAQTPCTPAIPGLPPGPGIPCSNDYTPNPTPLDPTDGPNEIGVAPNAEKHDRAACDADFMNQIYARSYLEANREIMITGRLISKPDSVLEYSCFDQAVRDTAQIAAPIFSNSQAWNGGAYSNVPNPGFNPQMIAFPPNVRVDMGAQGLTNALNAVVMNSLNNFVNTNNFTHSFLGGKATLDDTVGANVGAAGAACTHMRDVWQLAKCENINVTDMFRTFEQLAANDPRDIPLTGLPACGSNHINTDLIRVANNDPPPGAGPFDENRAGQYAFKDPIYHYLEFITWQDCVASPNPAIGNRVPIPTGVIVSQQSFNIGATGQITVNAAQTRTFPEHVCPNPSCHYRLATQSGDIGFGAAGECVP